MISFKTRSFAIDLGNNTTTVTDSDRMLLSQRSCIAFDRNNNSIRAVGDAAFEMLEKTHEGLQTIRPLQGGVIAHFEAATKMIHELVGKVYTGSFFKKFETIISGVPYYTTAVERKALFDALDQFNSRNTFLVCEPLAAALGMGLNIQDPYGKLVIDIGGGITEIAVISLSGVAAFQSIKTGGDSFDVAIQDHFRRTYNIAIGLKTAEQIKIQAGAVSSTLENPLPSVMVRGKHIGEGIPVLKQICSNEVAEVLQKSVESIEQGIIQTLEMCPPELSADICKDGAYVTGGGALLRGLQSRLERKIGLKVHIAPQPMYSVSKGIATMLKESRKYKSVLTIQ